jgi:replication factor C large subunit
MLSKSRGKRDLQDRVAGKIAEKLHTSKKVAISQFPYFEVMFQDNEIAYNMMTYFGLEDDEVKLFRSRKVKIPKKPKTKNVKTEPKLSKPPKKANKGSTEKTLTKKKKSKDKNSEKDTSKENSTKKEDNSENNEKQVSLFSFK